MIPIDYLADDTMDLIIVNGDFKKGDATLKHQKTLLLAEKGSFKQSPTVGVAIRDFILEDSSGDEFQGVVQGEFENDGMKINALVINSFSDINVDASYK